jgi:putative serine protease PepD
VTDSTNTPREGDPDIPRNEAHDHPIGDDATRPVPTTPAASDGAAAFYRNSFDEPVTAETSTAPAAVAEPSDGSETRAESDGAAFRRDRRKGLLLPVAAAAVVAALVGGGVGAGIAVAVSPHDLATTTTTNGNTTSSNITINNAKTATAISAVAAKASPSVVTISVNSSSEAGTGSGIVLTSDGYILTNDHVVTLEGASSTGTISVTTSNGRIYKASVVGMDPMNDLAVIKLADASGLTPAQWADSSKLNVGDTAIAIGAPLGLAGTVTNGIVSALNRSISVASSAVPKDGSGSDNNGNGNNGNGPFNFWDFGDGSGSSGQSTTTNSVSLAVIQTDAAINPGNSGGALLNAAGEVIGVNVAIASAGSGSSGGQSGNIGVGFAIPSNIAQRIAAELRSKKSATHGLLGASVGDADASTKSTVAGAFIQGVTSGGAAGSAGLKRGDVVTNFNGVPIGSATDLTAQVRALPGGASAKLTYVRGGQSTTVTVKLGTYRG